MATDSWSTSESLSSNIYTNKTSNYTPLSGTENTPHKNNMHQCKGSISQCNIHSALYLLLPENKIFIPFKHKNIRNLIYSKITPTENQV